MEELEKIHPIRKVLMSILNPLRYASEPKKIIKEIKKLYYSISEISEITVLKQYVLLYWESEFSMLKPKKNRNSNVKKG